MRVLQWWMAPSAHLNYSAATSRIVYDTVRSSDWVTAGSVGESMSVANGHGSDCASGVGCRMSHAIPSMAEAEAVNVIRCGEVDSLLFQLVSVAV